DGDWTLANQATESAKKLFERHRLFGDESALVAAIELARRALVIDPNPARDTRAVLARALLRRVSGHEAQLEKLAGELDDHTTADGAVSVRAKLALGHVDAAVRQWLAPIFAKDVAEWRYWHEFNIYDSAPDELETLRSAARAYELDDLAAAKSFFEK